MTLFNPEGSAIFGPGSEWFWTMAQFLVVVVSLFAIYRQLRAQGAANAISRIETIHNRYRAREMTLARLQVSRDLRYGQPPREMTARMDPIANFFDMLEEQRLAGFMSVREIDVNYGLALQVWWRILSPAIVGTRVIEEEPSLYSGFENITALCARAASRRGSDRAWILEMPLPDLLDENIKRTTEALQLLNDVASHAIPGPPASATAAATTSD